MKKHFGVKELSSLLTKKSFLTVFQQAKSNADKRLRNNIFWLPSFEALIAILRLTMSNLGMFLFFFFFNSNSWSHIIFCHLKFPMVIWKTYAYYYKACFQLLNIQKIFFGIFGRVYLLNIYNLMPLVFFAWELSFKTRLEALTFETKVGFLELIVKRMFIVTCLYK